MFKRAAPVTDGEKLAHFKQTRELIGGAHQLSAKKAPPPKKGAPKPAPAAKKTAPKAGAKPAPKPAAKPAAKPAPKKEVADEGGSATAFDDLKELNTFSAQEDQAIAAQLDGEAVVKEIGKSLGAAINPEVKNGDAKWAKK